MQHVKSEGVHYLILTMALESALTMNIGVPVPQVDINQGDITQNEDDLQFK